LIDDIERHVYFWCIQYYVPLRQLASGSVHLSFYENFCEKPEEEIEKIFRFLHKPFDQRIFQMLNIPSHVTREESAIKTGTSLIDSWRNHVTDRQLERAVEILKTFGLDCIYSEDSMPAVDAAYRVLQHIGKQPN